MAITLCRNGLLRRSTPSAADFSSVRCYRPHARAAGAALSSLEERVPAIGAFVPDLLFPSHPDPEVAQAVLTDIATSMMTVVSIVFADPLNDADPGLNAIFAAHPDQLHQGRVTQWTLGVFLGTFSYCIAALPAARSLPYPFVPIATVMGAMLLSRLCVGWLIYFIHHISNAISVNHIVDRIRRETELVIDELMPDPRRPFRFDAPIGDFPESPGFLIRSRQSGYIKFVHIERLLIARQGLPALPSFGAARGALHPGRRRADEGLSPR